MTNLEWKLLYVVAVVIVGTFWHWLVARRWEGMELLRRALGVVTLIGLAMVWAHFGFFDLDTLIWVLLAATAAGGVVAALYAEHWPLPQIARLRRELDGSEIET